MEPGDIILLHTDGVHAAGYEDRRRLEAVGARISAARERNRDAHREFAVKHRERLRQAGEGTGLTIRRDVCD